MEKKGKTLEKTRNSSQGEKNKEFQKNKERKDRVFLVFGHFSVTFFSSLVTGLPVPFCLPPFAAQRGRERKGPPEIINRNFGPAPLQRCVGDFCCINFGGFSWGFSWRIFLGTFSHKNEEKKSGEKIREKIRRLKIKSAKNPFCQKPVLRNFVSESGRFRVQISL